MYTSDIVLYQRTIHIQSSFLASAESFYEWDAVPVRGVHLDELVRLPGDAQHHRHLRRAVVHDAPVARVRP